MLPLSFSLCNIFSLIVQYKQCYTVFSLCKNSGFLKDAFSVLVVGLFLTSILAFLNAISGAFKASWSGYI